MARLLKTIVNCKITASKRNLMIFFWVKNREGKVASWLWRCTYQPDLSLTICETPDNVSRWNAAWQRWDVGAAGYGAGLPNPHLPLQKSLAVFFSASLFTKSFFIHSEKKDAISFQMGMCMCSTLAFNFRSPLLSLWVSWLTNAPGPPPTRPPRSRSWFLRDVLASSG